MIKLVKNGYYNFVDEILNNDNQHFNIGSAYFENGTVFISGVIKSGWSGVNKTKMIPPRYCPRAASNMVISFVSSNLDRTKVSSSYITAEGELVVWLIERLDYNEAFSVTYPLKST